MFEIRKDMHACMILTWIWIQDFPIGFQLVHLHMVLRKINQYYHYDFMTYLIMVCLGTKGDWWSFKTTYNANKWAAWKSFKPIKCGNWTSNYCLLMTWVWNIKWISFIRRNAWKKATLNCFCWNISTNYCRQIKNNTPVVGLHPCK